MNELLSLKSFLSCFYQVLSNQIGPLPILALSQKYQIYEHPVFEQVIEETFYSLPEASEMKGEHNPERHWNLRTPIFFN